MALPKLTKPSFGSRRRCVRADRALSANSGIVSGQEKARLHHRGLPSGSQETLRRTKRIAPALIFEAAVSREAAERKLIDDWFSLFGGRPIMAHLIRCSASGVNGIVPANVVATLLPLTFWVTVPVRFPLHSSPCSKNGS
jgi:hypothetical protein